MQFFVPLTSNDEEAQEILEIVSEYINMPILEKKIYKVAYTEKGKEMTATVGEPVDPSYEEGDQLVAAIFGTPEKLSICLPTRGVVRGKPIIVEGRVLEYFE